MVKIDENQEVIALIRMAVDNDKKARALNQTQLDTQTDSDPENHSDSHILEQHWTFGSQSGTKLNSRELEKKLAPSDCDFISFDERLRSFVMRSFPDEALHYEDLIYVRLVCCTASTNPIVTDSFFQMC